MLTKNKSTLAKKMSIEEEVAETISIFFTNLCNDSTGCFPSGQAQINIP